MKKELQGIYEANGKSAIFRSKVRWIEKGEKPIKYFLTLRKETTTKRLYHNSIMARRSSYQTSKKNKQRNRKSLIQFYKTNFDAGEEKKISRKFQSFVGNLNLKQLAEQENLESEAGINIEEV